MTTGAAAGSAATTRFVEHLMGMPVSLALRGRHAHDDVGRAAWDAVVADLGEVDRTFSTYRPDSWVSRWSRGEVRLADCPREVAEVAVIGERARRASGGAFDIRRPTPDGGRVLDPSGVVKGWAAQRAARFLRDLEGTDHCLNVGGDVVCWAAEKAGPGWRIGIEDPHDPTRLVAEVTVHRGAVATSGLTHRGAHVVDPRDGRTPDHLASVTVVADDLTSADVEATAALVLGADAEAWLSGRGRFAVLVGVDGAAHVVSAQPQPWNAVTPSRVGTNT